MSKVQVDKVVNLSDDGAPQLTYGAELPVGYGLTGAGGLNITGVVTAASAVFSGNVTIGGTLTYEDVTNIDVVGVSTFAGRMNVNSSALFNEGLSVTAGVTTIAGTSTFAKKTTVNATLEATEGLNVTNGIGTFSGSIYMADRIRHLGDTDTTIRFPSADTITAETGGTERIRITSDGDILLGTDQATIGNNTSDGSDDRSFSLCGGSDASQNRGSLVGLFGNEHGSFPGTLALRAGNVTGGRIEFSASGSEVGRIDENGRFLIGTTTEGEASADNLTIADSGNCGITIRSGTSNESNIFFSDGTSGSAEYMGAIQYDHNSNFLSVHTNASERMRLDSSGRLLIGDTTHRTGQKLEVSDTGSTGSLSLRRYSDNAHPSYVDFFKSRSGTLGGETVVQSGDNLGQITWGGSDGTDRAYAAFISAEVDGTPGSGDMPGRLVFETTPDGSETPVERMRISSTGKAYFQPLASNGFEVKWTDVDSAGPYGKFWNSDSVYGGGVQVKNNNGKGGVEFLNPSGNNVAAFYNSTGGWHWGSNLILDSGGIGFNDTATANHLDDYEEGSFTATMANSVTLNASNDLLSYIKIGKLVQVQGELRINDSNSGSDFQITNMPFTSEHPGEGSGYAVGSVSLYENDMNSGFTQVICKMSPNTTALHVQCLKASGNTAPSLDTDNSGYIGITITYRAA